MLGVLASIVEYLVGLWLIGMLAIVLVSIVTRRISLIGLLTDSLTHSRAQLTHPQLMLSSIAAASAYVSIAIADLGGARGLPDVPLWIIAVFAGSHSLYLGGRGASAVLTKMLGGN